MDLGAVRESHPPQDQAVSFHERPYAFSYAVVLQDSAAFNSNADRHLSLPGKALATRFWKLRAKRRYAKRKPKKAHSIVR